MSYLTILTSYFYGATMRSMWQRAEQWQQCFSLEPQNETAFFAQFTPEKNVGCSNEHDAAQDDLHALPEGDGEIDK
jgi:hypothetical protein